MAAIIFLPLELGLSNTSCLNPKYETEVPVFLLWALSSAVSDFLFLFCHCHEKAMLWLATVPEEGARPVE